MKLRRYMRNYYLNRAAYNVVVVGRTRLVIHYTKRSGLALPAAIAAGS